MAKIAKKKESNLSFDDTNIKITLPDISDSNNDEEKKNEYIDSLLKNLPEYVWTMEDQKEEPTENKEIVNENESQKKQRKLSKIDFIMLFLIILFELLQWIFLVILPARIFIITFVLGFFIVLGLSYLCNQYQMMFVQFTLLFVVSATMIGGWRRGLRNEQLSKMSMTRITYINQHTPVKTSHYSDDELKNKFIYYYRYGCSDCMATDNVIKGILKENKVDVINIETRSKIGKHMLKKYPVTEVPSGLVIHKDGSYTTSVLYEKDKAGKPIVSTNGIQKLLKLLKDE